MDKFNQLAWVFINSLNNEQRKQLHVLSNCDDGINALEDEVPSALHDQAHDGDEEAWELLNWDEPVVERILDNAVSVYSKI